AEPGEEIETLERQRIGLGGEIGEAVERDVARLELAEYVDRAGDRPRHHLVEALAERVDEMCLVGMLGLEDRRRLGEAAPGILALVPVLRADSGEEMLHRRLVGNQLAIEVARIPV